MTKYRYVEQFAQVPSAQQEQQVQEIPNTFSHKDYEVKVNTWCMKQQRDKIT